MSKIIQFVWIILIFVIYSNLLYAKTLNGVDIPDEIVELLNDARWRRASDIMGGLHRFSDMSVVELDSFLKKTIVYDATYYCPICKIYFPIMAKSLQIVCLNNDFECLDGFPENLDYRLPPECPYCNCIFPRSEVTKEKLEEFATFIWYPCFQALSDACERYVFLLDNIIGLDAYAKSEIFFKYSVNAKESRIYLEKALQLLNTFVEEKSKKNGIDAADIRLLIFRIDLSRQLSEWKTAKKYCDELKNWINQESYYKILLDLEYELISNHNKNRIRKPIGNELHIAILNNEKTNNNDFKNGIHILLKQLNKDGKTAFFQAIQSNRQSWVKYLLNNYKELVNTYDYYKNSPLHWAAKLGNLEQIKLLLNEGCDIEALNVRKQTPLFWAIRFGNYKAVEMLLRKGADCYTEDYEKQSPLQIACRYKNKDSEKIFFKLYDLQKKYKPNMYEEIQKCYLIAQQYNVSALEFLKKTGIKQDMKGNNLLNNIPASGI